jgi:hypothetical protein
LLSATEGTDERRLASCLPDGCPDGRAIPRSSTQPSTFNGRFFLSTGKIGLFAGQGLQFQPIPVFPEFGSQEGVFLRQSRNPVYSGINSREEWAYELVKDLKEMS